MDDRMDELDCSLPAPPASGNDSATPVTAPQTAVVALGSVPPLTSSRRFRVTPWAAGLAALLLVVALTGQRQGWLAGGSGPGDIARAQIEDLGRGQVRAAYD